MKEAPTYRSHVGAFLYPDVGGVNTAHDLTMSGHLNIGDAVRYARTGHRYTPTSPPVTAVTLTAPTLWKNSNGDDLIGEPGDDFLNDQSTEWSVKPHIFARTYSPIGDGRYRKTAGIHARQSNRTFTIDTLEGAATVNPGDWVVAGSSDDAWVIPDSVFARRYTRR